MTVLLCVGLVLVIGGVALFAHELMRPGGASLGGLLEDYQAMLDSEATFLSLRTSGAMLLRGQVALVVCCLSLSFAFRQPWFSATAFAVFAVPPFVLGNRHRARVATLERQLDGWLLLLANALRATPSLGDAITSTAALTPGEFGREIQLLEKELRLGVPVDRALRALAERTGSSVIASAMTTIVVARRTGGDLAAALEDSAASLRETARLEGVLRTKTAEGRGQVLVLAVSPFLLCAMIAWLEPTWFDAALADPHGVFLFVGCGLSWLAATVWAHKISEVPL